MADQRDNKGMGGITIIGLGPGNPGLLTRDALDWLNTVDTIYLRTRHHSSVTELSEHLQIESFDAVFAENESSEAANAIIVEKILALGKQPRGVTYAVPGSPFVAEATCPQIVRQAKQAGIPCKIIDGVSFLEPTFRLLEIDPFEDLMLLDAGILSTRLIPSFSPSSAVLITQITTRSVADEVKQVLKRVYPDDHPVIFVHQAGTEQEKCEKCTLIEMAESHLLGGFSSLYVSPLTPHASFEAFQEVIARLRAPGGCPWDREQTHTSLRPFLIEETYEALDALDREDMVDLQEELGDILLQILLHAQIASEEGYFNINHVIEGIATKLVRRHPHVFSSVNVDGVSGVIKNWEAIKAQERENNGASGKKGLLDGVPLALPALLQAQEVIDRALRVGFDPLHGEDSAIIRSHLEQLTSAEILDREDLLGEVLFKLVAVIHTLGMDAESALRTALNRFRTIFNAMEEHVLQSGRTLSELSMEEKSQLWNKFQSEPRDR